MNIAANTFRRFSNEIMWPLCHVAYVRPKFNENYWQHYQNVNKKFAEAIIQEVGDEKAVVFLQDYHLAICAKYIKMFKERFI